MSEQLVNEYFNDFPIDYFRIKPIDLEALFDAKGFENGTIANEHLEGFLNSNPYHIIDLNEQGYIGDELNDLLDYSQKDTTIINCAVGQGKTTAILNNLKKQYDENPDLYFIIAVPYVSLIEQYERDLINIGIHPDHIFNYSKLGGSIENGGKDYLQPNRRVHIVTANTLLGNPGENALMQSEPKHLYLTELSDLLEKNNKKVAFIFDEIHDTIHNFSDIGIIHLFKWEKVVNKIIVLSATYNVASIAVMRYFTKLTNNKFQIIESKRKVVRPQSKLFLHYDNGKYDKENYTIKNLVNTLLEQQKNIDVISYSKKLAKELLNKNGEIGRKLTERFGELKDCTSDLYDNQPDGDESPVNRFDNECCNIGTNFKTGVSINKENHAFIVILPPANTRRTYNSYNGIFNDGINSIIQTLARQRTNGEIHIVLPNPIEIDVTTLNHMNSDQALKFKSAYELISIPATSIETRNNVGFKINRYVSFDKHFDIIRDKYAKLFMRNFNAIIMAEKKEIHFPTIENFTIENASKALTEEGFLGRDLSSFVTYCAFTNQFYNARLEQIVFSPTYEMDQIDNVIPLAYSQYINENGGSNIYYDISNKYKHLRNRLIYNTSQILSDVDKKKIKTKIFQYLTNKSTHRNIASAPFVYILEEYYNLTNSSNEEKQQIINQLKYFIKKINDSIVTENGVRYLKKYEDNKIFENDKTQIFQLISLLKEKNDALKLSGAKFFRESNEETIDKDFYKFLYKALYITKRYQPQGNDYLKIERTLFLPQNL